MALPAVLFVTSEHFELAFCFVHEATDFKPDQPPLITCIQALRQAINLVEGKLVLIGHKWDFSWLSARGMTD